MLREAHAAGRGGRTVVVPRDDDAARHVGHGDRQHLIAGGGAHGEAVAIGGSGDRTQGGRGDDNQGAETVQAG